MKDKKNIDKKYEITNEAVMLDDHLLLRIRALKDFSDVKKRDVGGWVGKDNSLSHDGDCWIYDNAVACGDARVTENAKMYGNSLACDEVRLSGNAKMCFDSKAFGKSKIYGNGKTHGEVELHDETEVFDNANLCGALIIRGKSRIGGETTLDGDREYRNLMLPKILRNSGGQ